MRSFVAAVKFLVICGVFLSLISCNNNGGKEVKPDSLAIRKSIEEMPVLDANDAIKKMNVEDGFTIKLVAAEP